MKLKINALVNDSIVDGTGLRFTIFTQGCKHQCKGCHNPQTHDFSDGFWYDIDDILQIITENPLLDGITFSGGDPMEQAAACATLAQKAHTHGLTVWTYTGYTWEELLSMQNPDHMALLENTDILVDGRFLEDQRSLELCFKGSKNQRIINVPSSLTQNTIILWQPPT